MWEKHWESIGKALGPRWVPVEVLEEALEVLENLLDVLRKAVENYVPTRCESKRNANEIRNKSCAKQQISHRKERHKKPCIPDSSILRRQ